MALTNLAAKSVSDLNLFSESITLLQSTSSQTDKLKHSVVIKVTENYLISETVTYLNTN